MKFIFAKTLAGAATVAVLAAGTASATSVDLSYAGSVSGFRTVTIQEAPVIPVANPVNAGGFHMTDTSGTLGTFIAWCVDLTSFTTHGNFEFTITETPFSNSYGLNTNERQRVQTYFDANYSETLANDRDSSAAFQVGLWESLYDDDFSLTDNTAATDEFRANSSAAVNGLAAGFLAAAQGYGGGQKWDLTFLENNAGNKQNLITVSAVPVPAAGLLLIGGLAGLGAVGARRRRKA